MTSALPQSVNKTNWYYENKNSIDLVHQVFSQDGRYLKTDIITIPWRKLLVSAKRRSTP